jgi:hypothetical protein
MTVSRADAIIAYVEQNRRLIDGWLSGSVQFDWSAGIPGVKARLSRYDRTGRPAEQTKERAS